MTKDYEVVMDLRGFIRRVNLGWDDIWNAEIIMFPNKNLRIFKAKDYVYVQLDSNNESEARKKATSVFMQFVGKRWMKKVRKKK